MFDLCLLGEIASGIDKISLKVTPLYFRSRDKCHGRCGGTPVYEINSHEYCEDCAWDTVVRLCKCLQAFSISELHTLPKKSMEEIRNLLMGKLRPKA